MTDTDKNLFIYDIYSEKLLHKVTLPSEVICIYEIGESPKNIFQDFPMIKEDLIVAKEKAKDFSKLALSSLYIVEKIKTTDLEEKKYYMLNYEFATNKFRDYHLLSHKDDLVFELFFDFQEPTCFLLVYGTYSGDLCVKALFETEKEKFSQKNIEKKIHNYKITTVKINKNKKNSSEVLIASGSYDRRVTITCLKNFNTHDAMSLELLYSFTLEI